MKTSMIKLASVLFILTGIAVLFTQCESNANELQYFDQMALQVPNEATSTPVNGCTCILTEYPVEDLSANELTALVFMREEEKMARDVYLKLNEKWNMRVFANIAKAEQRHMDAVGCLLEKYDIDDPVEGNGPGEFNNDALQTLYIQLVAEGEQSLEKAMLAGATIEDTDIAHLLDYIESVDNADIKAVFGELMRGSRNHLRAFHRNLENLGADYEPLYISADLYEEIVTSPRERGGQLCSTCSGNGTGNCPYGNPGNGNGPGNGPGNCPNGNPGGGNGTGPGNGPCPNGGPGNGPGPGIGPGNGGN